jgi:hypothetical protein
MARSISTIKKTIIEEKNTKDNISVIQFAEEGGSRVGILNLWADVVSLCINVHEQLFDKHKSDVELLVDNAIPGTEKWIQSKVFEFQYDVTTPQYVELVDYVPAYPTIDTSLQIITRCSVISLGNGRITIKVAKSEPPVALSAPEKTALEGYITAIIPAGPYVTISTQDSDKLYIDAEVFYDGQYVDSIQATVEAAIKDYLDNLPFDGDVLNSKIQDAIQSVDGVNDVVINEVKARKDTTPISGATVVARKWSTVAGYIEEETTSSNTWSDTITYTVG